MAGFLIDEVSSSRPSDVGRLRRRPRVLVGAAATAAVAAVLAGVLTTVPGGAPPAAAVAIDEEGGWTTVRIVDPDAAPEAVLAELEAAGIDARIERIDRPDGPAIGTLPDGGDFAVIGFDGDDTGLIGITIDVAAVLPDPDPSEPSPPKTITEGSATVPAESTTPDHGGDASTRPGEPMDGLDGPPIAEALEDAGVRIQGDSVSIRHGSDVELVLIVAI